MIDPATKAETIVTVTVTEDDAFIHYNQQQRAIPPQPGRTPACAKGLSPTNGAGRGRSCGSPPTMRQRSAVRAEPASSVACRFDLCRNPNDSRGQMRENAVRLAGVATEVARPCDRGRGLSPHPRGSVAHRWRPSVARDWHRSDRTGSREARGERASRLGMLSVGAPTTGRTFGPEDARCTLARDPYPPTGCSEIGTRPSRTTPASRTMLPEVAHRLSASRTRVRADGHGHSRLRRSLPCPQLNAAFGINGAGLASVAGLEVGVTSEHAARLRPAPPAPACCPPR